MRLFCLGIEQIDSLWSEYGHHLERYEAEGWDYAESVRKDLKGAAKQLWGIQADTGKVVGVIVTRIADTPRGDVCEIHAACGSSRGLPSAVQLAMPAIEQWARDIGCVSVKVIGRKGWKRVLSDYRFAGVVMEKEL